MGILDENEFHEQSRKSEQWNDQTPSHYLIAAQEWAIEIVCERRNEKQRDEQIL